MEPTTAFFLGVIVGATIMLGAFVYAVVRYPTK